MHCFFKVLNIDRIGAGESYPARGTMWKTTRRWLFVFWILSMPASQPATHSYWLDQPGLWILLSIPFFFLFLHKRMTMCHQSLENLWQSKDKVKTKLWKCRRTTTLRVPRLPLVNQKKMFVKVLKLNPSPGNCIYPACNSKGHPISSLSPTQYFTSVFSGRTCQFS